MLADLRIFAFERDGSSLFATDARLSESASRSGLRFQAFKAYHDKAHPLLGCPACPGHLYPKLSPNGRVCLSHISSDDCPLAQDRALSERQLDAMLYGGRQEGPAHEALVAAIVGMASADPRIDKASIATGQYVAAGLQGIHGRFPDARFDFDGGSLAFEVQLSPISLHRLAERTIFYRDRGIALVWVTRNFDPMALRPTWLWDVWAAQRGVAYSIDDDLLGRASTQGRFLLRRYRTDVEGSDLVGLEDLAPPPWYTVFKRRWRAAAGDNWTDALALTRELLAERNIAVDEAETLAICHTINTMIAIESWESVGSGHINPRAIVNDFLNSADGRLAFKFVWFALRRCRPGALHEGKTAEKIAEAERRATAEGQAPWDAASPMAAIARELFPDWKKPN